MISQSLTGLARLMLSDPSKRKRLDLRAQDCAQEETRSAMVAVSEAGSLHAERKTRALHPLGGGL